MNAQLKSIRKQDIATLPKEKQLPAMLDMFQAEIKRALPKHITPDRMCRIALTAFRQNPALAKCNPATVFAAIIQSSQLGLELGINGHAYLVPYNNNCSFIPGWKGLVDLVNRAGRSSVWTGAVSIGDEFDYGQGDRPFIHHKPLGISDTLTHFYAVGRVNNSEWPIIDVWSIKKVEAHRDKWNKVGKSHYSFQHFEMYARKVVLLQVLKYLPSSAEMNQAIALNDAAEIGRQNLNIDDVIDGTWAPSEEPGQTVSADLNEVIAGASKPEPSPPPSSGKGEGKAETNWAQLIEDAQSQQELLDIAKAAPPEFQDAIDLKVDAFRSAS